MAAAVLDCRDQHTPDYGERGASSPRPPRQVAARLAASRPVVLVIDNYDSFTYNLVHLLQSAGARVEVVRNDEVTAAEAAGSCPAAVVLSPGPCAPAEAGICVDVVRALGGRTPVLGVCLGHQAIAVAYGGQIERVAPVHGKASLIEHDGLGIFAGAPGVVPGGSLPLAAGHRGQSARWCWRSARAQAGCRWPSGTASIRSTESSSIPSRS